MSEELNEVRKKREERRASMQRKQNALNATRLLQKFCKDHHHSDFFISKLGECATAIEGKDLAKVREINLLCSRGGMGSYLDWYPNVICDHEDADYVTKVWYLIDDNWRKALSHLLSDNAESVVSS
jgi:hypothetical protein